MHPHHQLSLRLLEVWEASPTYLFCNLTTFFFLRLDTVSVGIFLYGLLLVVVVVVVVIFIRMSVCVCVCVFLENI